MDMNLQIIQNPKFGKVRFQMIDGDPWFCGKDVCDILGYSNPWKAMQDFLYLYFQLQKSLNAG